MEFRQLEYFLILCEELHFTRAAERLHISQPTLSQQIKVLEQYFGMPLFDRIGKKIHLTTGGQLLYNQSLQIFKQVENTKQQMQELQQTEKGQVMIAALPGELTNLVSESVLDYLSDYPEMQVSVLSTDDVYKLIKENKVDFAFSYTEYGIPIIEPDMIEIPLYKEQFYYVTHTHDPLASYQHLTLQHVADTPLVLFPGAHVCRQILNKALKKDTISLNIRLETASIPTIFQFVTRQMGGTIITKTLFDIYQDPTLIGIPIQHEGLNRETVLIMKKDKYMSKAAKLFMRRWFDYITKYKLLLSENPFIEQLIEQ